MFNIPVYVNWTYTGLTLLNLTKYLRSLYLNKLSRFFAKKKEVLKYTCISCVSVSKKLVY